MFSPIGFRGFDSEEYRQRIRSLSDDELIKEGKKLRSLSGDGKIVSTQPCVFDDQLKIYREEQRRRKTYLDHC